MLQVIKSKNKTNPGKTAKKKAASPESTIQSTIESHVKKIRALIEKLPPRDRQEYFSGLLNHMLAETEESLSKKKDPNKLSRTELVLLDELSVKMEELYRTMDYNPHI